MDAGVNFGRAVYASGTTMLHDGMIQDHGLVLFSIGMGRAGLHLSGCIRHQVENREHAHASAEARCTRDGRSQLILQSEHLTHHVEDSREVKHSVHIWMWMDQLNM